MRPHPRRARTNPSSPRAWATSDRNGMLNNHQDLRWQWDWAGQKLVNKKILCSADELDRPQRQLGTFIMPPDPTPIMNARVERYDIDENPVSVRYTTDGRIRIVAGIVRGSGAADVIERMVAVAGNLSAANLAGVR